MRVFAAVELALLPLSSTADCDSSSKGGQYDMRTVCTAHPKAGRGRTAQKPIGTHKAGVWRFLNLEVSADKDLGKDDYSVSHPLLEAIAHRLACPISKDPRFVYTVDLHIEELQAATSRADKVGQFLKNKPGKLEFIPGNTNIADVTALVSHCKAASMMSMTEKTEKAQDNGVSANVMQYSHAKVTVVGSGPAGLFAALVLAESGAKVTLLERGQPVESRGRDIGQLMVRRVLQPDSNFCYGEGGAGTWSDGKLTTQIGRNSDTVKTVLASLVKFGASSTILIDGKPHIGTDRLIHILRRMRSYLQSLGVQIQFGTKMVDLLVRDNRIAGVKVKNADDSNCEDVMSDAVVLAVGHSARDLYFKLLEHGIQFSPKDFAVGFRVEHPQELINEIQNHCSTASGHQRCREAVEKYQ